MAEAPSRQLERAAASLRRGAAVESERVFTEALTAGRPDLGTGRIKAPPALERRAQRFGGGYRARSAEYDWFYSLAPQEQARIRENWMTSEGGVSPDEVEAMGLPMGEWLALTRGIDASRAVQTGRHVQAKRYGGRNPLAYLATGPPEDHGTPVRRFTSRRTGVSHDIGRDDQVQFFTDSNGVVHPIRASYEGRSARTTTLPTYFAERGDEAF